MEWARCIAGALRSCKRFVCGLLAMGSGFVVLLWAGETGTWHGGGSRDTKLMMRIGNSTATSDASVLAIETLT